MVEAGRPRGEPMIAVIVAGKVAIMRDWKCLDHDLKRLRRGLQQTCTGFTLPSWRPCLCSSLATRATFACVPIITFGPSFEIDATRFDIQRRSLSLRLFILLFRLA